MQANNIPQNINSNWEDTNKWTSSITNSKDCRNVVINILDKNNLSPVEQANLNTIEQFLIFKSTMVTFDLYKDMEEVISNIENTCDINFQSSKNWWSALMFAASFDNYGVIRDLLWLWADKALISKTWTTAFDIWKINRVREEILELLYIKK